MDHLAAATNSSFEDAFRDWAKTGTTLTGGGTMGYFGLKSGDADHTDLIVQLAKREGATAPDRIRFLFTSTLSGAANGATSQEGLEGMRLTAVSNSAVNVGIGDFFAAGVGEPAERLDLVNGKVRIRQLPIDLVSTSTEAVVLNTTTGVLEHRPFPPATDCKWTMNVASPNNVYTALGAVNPNCPDASEKVGIGTNSPQYKLDVYQNVANGSMPGGQRVIFLGPSTGWSYGIKSELYPGSVGSLDRAAGMHSLASGGTAECWGLLGSASATTATSALLGGVSATATATSGTITNAYGSRNKVITTTGSTVNTAMGVYGVVEGAGLASTAYGVYGYGQRGSTETYGGYFWGNGPSSTTTTYGVVGRATGTGTNWAGFFTGPVSVAGTVYPSDEHLKTDIQDLQGPTALLMQLHPKSYTYRHEEFPQMDLPDGLRYGFIAQDVQEAFPQFTTPVHQPEQLDSAGNEVFASVDYLGLNTADIIPLLVGAVQEQHVSVSSVAAAQGVHTGELQALRDRMQELENMLAACCARADADGMRNAPSTTSALSSDPAAGRKLRIVPNPFSEPPTVFYTLDRSGRPADGGMRHMQLIANSADGKELTVLQEATLQAGDYQYAWDTNTLAPGMYYVTLLLNDEQVVKKAVKVTR